MAKLYWRIKRAGKWTWVAATPENTKYPNHRTLIRYIGPDRVLGYDHDIEDRPDPWKPEIASLRALFREDTGEEE